MGIENGALLRGVLGAGLVGGGATGAYYGYQYVGGHAQNQTSESRSDGDQITPPSPTGEETVTDVGGGSAVTTEHSDGVPAAQPPSEPTNSGTPELKTKGAQETPQGSPNGGGTNDQKPQESGGPSNPDATKENPSSSETSKYDDALLDFLKKEDNDIVFKVKYQRHVTKENKWIEHDLTADLIAFESSKITIYTVATIDTGDANQFKGEKADALRAKNSNRDWKWTCSLGFQKTLSWDSPKKLKEDYRNRIFTKDKGGLMGILQRDITTHNIANEADGKWTKSQLKAEKINFITRCAKIRSSNAALNAGGSTLSADELKVTKIFQMDKLEEADKKYLIPKNEGDFNEWFKEEYATKTYQ